MNFKFNRFNYPISRKNRLPLICGKYIFKLKGYDNIYRLNISKDSRRKQIYVYIYLKLSNNKLYLNSNRNIILDHIYQLDQNLNIKSND
jgi:hypothetical protein